MKLVSDRPIGVFDSGIGGLTVLRALRTAFPEEDFIYIGDTARVPYGSKSPTIIRQYTEEMISQLYQKNVKAIVIACNSASTQFSEKFYNECPVFNVIDPGVEKAISLTQTKTIGIIGTRATIQSGIYQKRLLQACPDLTIISQSCPLFVPLAEEGWFDDPVTNLIAFRYLQILLEQDLDVLILGCTHYPLLTNAIKKVVGNSVTLVEAGDTLASIIRKQMETGHLHPHSQRGNAQGTLDLITTDNSEFSYNLAQKILL